MKNLFNKIMSAFKSSLLTVEQKKAIAAQIDAYSREILTNAIEMAFSETHEEMCRISLKNSMAKHRRSCLVIKLLRSCDCGKDHSEDIQTEENILRMYSDQLQLFLLKK